MKRRRALITGITGQDGSYLAEFLLSKGYAVHGMVRRASTEPFERIDHIRNRITIHQGDLLDQSSLVRVVKRVRPREVYNLGAQSFVPTSWIEPASTAEITALGVIRVLDAIRLVDPKIRFYQASSSEVFGKVRETPQTEKTGFYPRNPYACCKAFGHNITVNYRESYGMFAVSGILFNHESERRGVDFVTRKITRAVAAIEAGRQKTLYLGNLNPKRDWGHAEDYVRAMWMMLQAKTPKDYVVSSGKCHSVREFCQIAFAHAGLDWKKYVKVSKKFFRPAEVMRLEGDSRKIRRELGWKPKVSFRNLVERMVEHDMDRIFRR